MGKGAMSGEKTLQLRQKTTRVLFTRAAWGGFLRDHLDKLLEAALLIDSETGRGMVADLLGSYFDGQGGEDAWMSDFSAAARVRLAEMLHEERHPGGAAQMINHDSLPLDMQVKILNQFRDDAPSPRARSLYRQALASVFYRQMQLDWARTQLQADIDDPDSTPEMKSLAETKLDALSEVEPPRGWQWRLVPPEMRSGPMNGTAFGVLISHMPESRDSYFAFKQLVPELSRAGYHREALDLASRMMDAHSGNRGFSWNAHMVYAKALEDAGRVDEAAAFHLRSAAKFGHRGAEAEGNYKAAQEIYDKAGMPDSAIGVARIRRQYAAPSAFMEAHRDILDRMVAQGDVDGALREAGAPGEDGQDSDPRLSEEPGTVKQLALARALRPASIRHNKPSRSLRSLLRRRLVEELIHAGLLGAALERLEEELGDPGIDPIDQSWAEQQIEVLQAEQRAAAD